MVLINGGGALDRFGHSDLLGRLVSPRSGNAIRTGEKWAGDNDAFGAWDEARFLAMLRRRRGTPDCLFVAVPDVVGDAHATVERFHEWSPVVREHGFPVALVGQDGAESVALPWDECDAWFIGGTDAWKLYPASADLAREAKARGKWLHMGRVNTLGRIREAHAFGCDSIDGSGWSRFPDTYLKRYFPFLQGHIKQPLMF